DDGGFRAEHDARPARGRRTAPVRLWQGPRAGAAAFPRVGDAAVVRQRWYGRAPPADRGKSLRLRLRSRSRLLHAQCGTGLWRGGGHRRRAKRCDTGPLDRPHPGRGGARPTAATTSAAAGVELGRHHSCRRSRTGGCGLADSANPGHLPGKIPSRLRGQPKGVGGDAVRWSEAYARTLNSRDTVDTADTMEPAAAPAGCTVSTVSIVSPAAKAALADGTAQIGNTVHSVTAPIS